MASASASLAAEEHADQTSSAISVPFVGEWSVDLRLSTDDQAYNQPMELSVVDNGELEGEFYGSTIEAGRYGTAQGRTCLAFRTSDSSGPYYHSACLRDDKLVGQTWSPGRSFVLPWTAIRPLKKD